MPFPQGDSGRKADRAALQAGECADMRQAPSIGENALLYSWFPGKVILPKQTSVSLAPPLPFFLAEVEWGIWLEGSRSLYCLERICPRSWMWSLFPEAVSRANRSALQTHTPIVSGLDRDLGREISGPFVFPAPLSHPTPGCSSPSSFSSPILLPPPPLPSPPPLPYPSIFSFLGWGPV